MTYTQTIDATEFWSWKKVEAGHYVLTTDDRYTATVTKDDYGNGWTAEAVSPSGRTRGSHQWHESMADAREWALWQIDHLVQQDETERWANVLRPTRGRRSEVVMSGPGEQTASFTVRGVHHAYKVTVERWNG